ncbi:MAG: hypothetical protein J2P41_19625, partial [Blastocatellia bacterium]|nr:hypothetical protein [Blastocatellia bacterium]
MTKKLSLEARRRLLEEAKARMARREERQAAIPAVIAALDVAVLEEQAGASVAKRGSFYLKNKLNFAVESISSNSATVEVHGVKSYLVTFELANGQVYGFCECPLDDDDAAEEVICEHKIAAALYFKTLCAPKAVSA